MIIEGPIKTGLIKIGYDFSGDPKYILPNVILLTGKIIFKGYAIISKGTLLSVEDSILTIGNRCTIGSGSIIKCLYSITIGDNTQITHGCTVFDCEMHYIKNIESGVIRNNRGPIKIGNNCWINSGTFISKNTVIPDYSITARNSFLNKDYSPFGANLLLVGSPAEVKSMKVQRIFDIYEQRRLNEYFRNYPQENQFNDSKGLFIEKVENYEIFFDR
jgi:acetyltransferase-like isoleucine patch superfamily enzyme